MTKEEKAIYTEILKEQSKIKGGKKTVIRMVQKAKALDMVKEAIQKTIIIMEGQSYETDEAEAAMRIKTDVLRSVQEAILKSDLEPLFNLTECIRTNNPKSAWKPHKGEFDTDKQRIARQKLLAHFGSEERVEEELRKMRFKESLRKAEMRKSVTDLS